MGKYLPTAAEDSVQVRVLEIDVEDDVVRPGDPAERCGDVYRAKRSSPRSDDSRSVPVDRVAVLSPLNIAVYTFSNAMVGHAARVQAIAGPAVRVRPDRVKPAPQMLQSALVDKRPAAKLRV